MKKVWKRHWPPGVDEANIHLPREPLTAFVDALPKTASGKILKRALREEARLLTLPCESAR